MRDLGAVDTFAAGAIGPPGERVFVIQVGVAGEVSSFVAEKFQVAALALRARELLQEAGFLDAGAVASPELGMLDEAQFRVGDMYLDYQEEAGVVLIGLESADQAVEGVRFSVTPAQLDAAARIAIDVVEAGRPKCPRCGLAMDPDGHPCPTENGNLRGHRP